MKLNFRHGNTGLSIFVASIIIASMLLAGAGELYAGICDDDCHNECESDCENCDECVRCVSSIDMIDGAARLTIQSDLNSSWIVLSLFSHYDNDLPDGPDHPPRHIR